MRRLICTLLVATALVACSRATVDRAHWQQMPAAERTLWIRQMIGAEQARAAKGGNDHTWSRPAESYVSRIDAAYAHGDQRDVRTIFESMADPR